MNLHICILKSQPLADGRYKVRIALSHNRETRYFVTDACVSSEKNIKNGAISAKEAGAKEMNIRLQAMMTKIQTAFDQIEGADFYTCAEVVDMIKVKMKGSKPKTIKEIFDMIVSRKILQGREKNTLHTYDLAIKTILRFFGNEKTMASLTDEDLLRFKVWMNEVEHVHHTDKPENIYGAKFGLAETTQRLVLTKLKSAYNFSIKQKIIFPDTDIWDGFEMPLQEKRDCDLSIDELRRVRDAVFEDDYLGEVRDFFMLSFYLCGMNYADILEQDLSKPCIAYRRKKTKRSRPKDEITEFTIQPEAQAIIKRFWKDGRFSFHNGIRLKGILVALQRKLPIIKKECNINSMFVFYSARKTFSQLCLELGVPDAVNAYCIGDTPTKSTLNAYRVANKTLADKYIRKVFDFVASNQTLEEAIASI